MGDLSDFERGQIVWGTFSWSIYDRNCHIITCIKSGSFLGYVGIYKLWKDNISEEEQWAKIDTDRKKTTVSKNHRTTAAHATEELNINFEDFPSTKTARCDFHKSNNIHSRVATAKPLVTESNAMMRGVTTMKPGQTTGNARVIWSDESPFALFPTSGRVYVCRTAKEANNPECLIRMVKHRGGSVMVWAAISWYSILLVPL
jgi:hypothetical protein